MRAVKVAFGGVDVTLRIPVPSKILASLATLQTDGDIASLEVAYVGVLSVHAVEWPWSREPAAAWEAMWDAGVSWPEVQAAVGAWVSACNEALGVLMEAAKAKEATFPSGPAGDGDRQP
jgi:hypothetical protein